jgi:hypothetical protein
MCRVVPRYSLPWRSLVAYQPPLANLFSYFTPHVLFVRLNAEELFGMSSRTIPPCHASHHTERCVAVINTHIENDGELVWSGLVKVYQLHKFPERSVRKQVSGQFPVPHFVD